MNILSLAKGILSLTDERLNEMRKDFLFVSSDMMREVFDVAPATFNPDEEMAEVLFQEMCSQVAKINWDEQFIKDFRPDGLDELVLEALKKKLEDVTSVRDYFVNLRKKNGIDKEEV